jgi:hypothetical protein
MPWLLVEMFLDKMVQIKKNPSIVCYWVSKADET